MNDPISIVKQEIDSILHNFDLSLSGYIPNSVVSQWNQATTVFNIPNDDVYFLPCLKVSQQIYRQTQGAFDPTVLPLMELWGFLKDTKTIPGSREVDSVLQFIGFEEGELYTTDFDQGKRQLHKKDARLKFDFNAIAQGYSVDVIADYLQKKGAKNFYVEIGGEIYVKGRNKEGVPWRLGVDKPVATNDGDKQRVISAVIQVSDAGIATSGNYRKFYEKDGRIFAHTLNPLTGSPAENELLSATVKAETAAIADGLATAFMVMGVEKAKAFLSKNPALDVEVLFIYTGENKALKSYASPGMYKMLK